MDSKSAVRHLECSSKMLWRRGEMGLLVGFEKRDGPASLV